jgi:hypothetical protein
MASSLNANICVNLCNLWLAVRGSEYLNSDFFFLPHDIVVKSIDYHKGLCILG